MSRRAVSTDPMALMWRGLVDTVLAQPREEEALSDAPESVASVRVLAGRREQSLLLALLVESVLGQGEDSPGRALKLRALAVWLMERRFGPSDSAPGILELVHGAPERIGKKDNRGLISAAEAQSIPHTMSGFLKTLLMHDSAVETGAGPRPGTYLYNAVDYHQPELLGLHSLIPDSTEWKEKRAGVLPKLEHEARAMVVGDGAAPVTWIHYLMHSVTKEVRTRPELLARPGEYLAVGLPAREDTSELSPWRLTSDCLEIVETHEAEIIGEDEGEYVIAFPDYDGELVEANIDKSDFDALPHPVRVGSLFGLVVYRKKGSRTTSASVWPVSRYWHPSLQATVDA